MRGTRIYGVFLGVLLAGCNPANTTVKTDPGKASPLHLVFTPGPHVLVYRTTTDLADKVPVILTDDGSSLVSYPDPDDVRNAAARPTPLHQGYLLDNRGIGLNVAFLSMTYADYSALPSVPSEVELMNLIADKHPLKELCDCGSRAAFTDVPAQLDSLIDEGRLRTLCKVLK